MKLIILNLFMLFYCICSHELEYSMTELPESIILDVKLLPDVDYNIHVNEHRLLIYRANGIAVLNYSMPQYVLYEKLKTVQTGTKVLIIMPKRIYETDIVIEPKAEPVIKYKDIDIHEQIRLFGII